MSLPTLEGPIDEQFGQLSAFPLPEGDTVDQDTQDAYTYLASVRKQAESETSVFYSVRRDLLALEDGEQIGNDTKELYSDQHNSKNNEKEIEPLVQWQFNFQTEFKSIKAELTQLQRLGRLTPRSWPEPIPSTGKQWRTAMLDQSPPPIAHFFSLDHSTTLRLVVYATKWLSTGTRISLSKWIWCLLIRLDTPLDASDTSIIRELGVKALKLWEKTNGGVGVSPTAKHCWAMIVTIVGSYYRQSDLALARTK
ncbi:uncharacterized protein KQ657_005076 [Scheffersomyces spartinae]|uniref:Uncharacterized protein n=1 Tax=Scheffersomyces spartinae TaxID=45513 RepID=A0A9P7V9U8_9ASCO|nr:uncharacterized protein KQ657_005076 [Scheffersomyces spartinae]KAG7193878.1 hypothetical protein KQ657_005076 [Scheffersomyces spartinae]